jgi:branched-chain amino acid transport system ATP-binding protein
MFSVKELTVHYGKVQALRGVSVELAEGQIVTLIGANGAGKSTLLRTVSGLLRPTSGEIWLDGKRIDQTSPRDIVKMGVAQVPEGRRVFPYMSVLDNLKTGAYTRQDKQGVDQDMERVYSHFPVLKVRGGQSAGTLSGGEQQMLAMGRALMARPNLLLLDEPSLGLSPLLVKEIAKIIRDINGQGKSIILVEQNAALALRLAHRGYVIQTGAIVLEGTNQDLLSNEDVKKAYLGGVASS